MAIIYTAYRYGLRAYLRRRADQNPLLFPSRLGGPIHRSTLHLIFRKYAERASLPPEKRHFHTLKHSICTHLLDAGADVGFVRNWVGHANIQNTLVYAQLRDQTRDGQARRWMGSERLV